MKTHRIISFAYALLMTLALILIPSPAQASEAVGEFPQKNVWYQATPSVVWANDPESTTTLEVHIVDRDDVKRVWLTNLGSTESDARKELFDDGTHGDQSPGDNVFTLADVVLPAFETNGGYGNWWGFLRAELDDGTLLANYYGMMVGTVDSKYKDAFPAVDLGDGLSATAYAFFIEDRNHDVINNYPVSEIYCGTKNFEAYNKLYTVFPDVFDFAVLMPGMQIFRSRDLAENVPYEVNVSNNVEHIGLPIMDDTEKFGSSGRLKSVIYHSFGSIEIMDHELGHTWGVAIGEKLELIHGQDNRHWNEMADMQGQMGRNYFEGDDAGHFAYNGDGTWRFLTTAINEPYSPLELYTMGLIPSSEIPDVHILTNPDLSNPERITVESFKTITAEQIVAGAGGERIPNAADSQKEFNLAVIVTQDLPYNDAAYAYFSLLSHELMSREPPRGNFYFAPFYWATQGRATLNTYLGDYGVLALPALTAAPVSTPENTEPSIPKSLPAATPALSPTVSPDADVTAAAETETDGSSYAKFIILGALGAAAIAATVIILARKGKHGKRK